MSARPAPGDRRLTLAALAVAALALPASADAAPIEVSAEPRGSVAEYWTEERMQAARPLELSRDGGQARLRAAVAERATPRAQPVPFFSSEVFDPSVFPNSANGKLFGTLRELGQFSCSATVLDTPNGRVLMTAGHCVYDPFVSRFSKRLLFVPAYQDGAAPFGGWEWTSSATTRQWARDANSNFDFATIKLRKAGGVPISQVTGARPLAAYQPPNQSYGAFGYPQAFAAGERMWSCMSGYAGEDARAPREGKPAIAIGCDMTGGVSGGGWFTAAGLSSVSSFGYRSQPNMLYGPRLGRKAVQLVAQVGG